MFLSSESLKNKEFLELLDPSMPAVKRYMSDPMFISVLGPDGSGKTSLIKAQIFLHRTEDCVYDDSRKYEDGQDINIKGETSACRVYEITTDDYHKTAFHPQMISRSEGYLVLVDSSDLSNTYTEVDKIMKTIKTFHDSEIPYCAILVGNKSDIVKNKTKKDNGLKHINDKFFKNEYFETSTVTFENVEEVFVALVSQIWKNRKSNGFSEKGESSNKL